MCEISLIEDIEQLRLIYEPWYNIYQGNSKLTPFQSPDWVFPWCKYFICNYDAERQSKIFVLYLKDKDLPVCVAPFYISMEKGYKELKFIGTGNSDYSNLVFRKEYEIAAPKLIKDFIFRNKSHWNHIYFEGIEQNKFLLQFNSKSIFKEKEPYPVVDLPSSFDEYTKRLSPKFFKNIQRNIRLLQSGGELLFESAGHNSLNEFILQLFNLHSLRWNYRNSSGVLSDNLIKSFHKEVVFNLYKHNSISLFRLSFNKEPIALLYMLKKGKVYYYYTSGFSPGFKKFSPGSILIFKIVENAVQNGIKQINFLKGGEEYKYKWGAKDNYTYKIIFNNKDRVLS